MDFIRSYFGTNEPLTSWTLLPSLFFQISTDLEKKVRTKVRGSFVLNKVTSYKIPILAVQRILKKFFPLSRRLNPIMGPENSLTNLKMAEHHRTPKTKQQKSAKRSSALATKQVAFVRQVSKRVPRCGAVRTAGPNTKFPPKIRSKNLWNWPSQNILGSVKMDWCQKGFQRGSKLQKKVSNN